MEALMYGLSRQRRLGTDLGVMTAALKHRVCTVAGLAALGRQRSGNRKPVSERPGNKPTSYPEARGKGA